MDTTIKVTSIHVIFGIVAAAISFIFSTGWIGFKNDVFELFGDEVSGFSQWLWDGILPFGFMWIIAFTVLYNYIPF